MVLQCLLNFGHNLLIVCFDSCSYQRSTTAISVGNSHIFYALLLIVTLCAVSQFSSFLLSFVFFVVAPICYAHLAAAQMGTVMKYEEMSETSSSHGGITTPGAVHVPPMPQLNKNVATSMFFC